MRYYSSKKVKFKIKLSCFCGLEFKETKGQNSSSPTSYSALSQLEGISMPGESLRSFSNRSLSCSSWNGGRFRRSSKLENNNTSKSVTYFFFFFLLRSLQFQQNMQNDPSTSSTPIIFRKQANSQQIFQPKCILRISTLGCEQYFGWPKAILETTVSQRCQLTDMKSPESVTCELKPSQEKASYRLIPALWHLVFTISRKLYL